jgi:hypothetical protein
VYSYFLPWITFVIVDRNGGPGLIWASSVAAACAAGTALYAWYRGRGSYALLATMAPFVGILFAILLVGTSGTESDLPFVRVLVAVAMAAILACSLLLGGPATQDQVGLLVAPQMKLTSGFRQLNREMTMGWAIGSGAVAASFALPIALSGPIVRTVCDWLVPFLIGSALVHRDHEKWQTFGEMVVPADVAFYDDAELLHAAPTLTMVKSITETTHDI